MSNTPDPIEPFRGMAQFGRQLQAMRENMQAATVFGRAYRGEIDAARELLATLPIEDQIRVRAACKILLDSP